MTTQRFDCIVIGAGIAGASFAHFLAPHAKVLVLERESQPGYHSTGRSAAAFIETYGPPQVQMLTRASRAFLESPPHGFVDTPILPRIAAMMLLGSPGQEAQLQAAHEELGALNDRVRLIDAAEALSRVPVLVPERVAGAVLEPDAADIDVHCLHQGYLRGMRRAGGELHCEQRLDSIERIGGIWRVRVGGNDFVAPLLVDAAGAWADDVAEQAGVTPLGFQPRRRSAFVFRPPEGLACADWPLTAGIDEDWYIKPEAGLLLGSPANADDCPAHDVQPEELDIAIGIDRIQTMTTLRIRRPERTWAGLRTFSPDGELVGGFDERTEGFFWLAGQGGYGIQTSAAMGEACAALARGAPIPEHLARFGITADLLGPRRLRRAA